MTERSRVAQACALCKQKKLKCDGAQPCSRCSRLSEECVYAPRRQRFLSRRPARGLEDVHSAIQDAETLLSLDDVQIDNGGIGDDTVYQLRNRLRGLQRALDNYSHRPLVTPSPHNFADQSLADHIEPRGQLDQSDQDEVGQMDQYEATRIRYTRRYYNSLPRVFGHHLQSTITPRLQLYGWNMSGVSYLDSRKFPATAPLLSPELERELLSYYFDHINPLFAILHEPVFLQQYEAYRAELSGNDSAVRLYLANMHAACALSMRFMNNARVREFPARLEEALFDHAYETIQAYSFEFESVEIVQGLLLLTMYVRTCHRQSSTWSLLGQALRLAYGIALMKPLYHARVSSYSGLKARRVFWCCYTWDRLIAVEMGRSCSIPDSDIQGPVPSTYQDDGWLTPAAFALLRLAHIVSPFMAAPLSSEAMLQLRVRFAEWDHVVQSELNLGSDKSYSASDGPQTRAAMLCQLRLMFHETVLFMLQSSLYPLTLDRRHEAPLVQANATALTTAAQAAITTVDSYVLWSGASVDIVWWSVLSTLHAACLVLLVNINAGLSGQLLEPFQRGMALLDLFANDRRYRMAGECQWSLRVLNYGVGQRLERTAVALYGAGAEAGNDQGPNKKRFGALDRNADVDAEPEPAFNEWGTANALSLDWLDGWTFDQGSAEASFLVRDDY